MTTTAMIGLAFFSATMVAIWPLEICLFIMGAGMGLTMPNLTVAVQNAVDRGRLGQATATLSFTRSLGGSLGVSLFGGLMTVGGLLTPQGAASFGWTAYAPLSDTTFTPGLGGTLWASGLTLTGFSTILGSVNFITTIVTMRAPGLTMFRLPIFCWNTLITSLLVLMAFPVLATALFVHCDRLAALLDHLAQHLGDEHVVVGGRLARARLDVAVLDRRHDEADRGEAGLVAPFHRGDLGLLDRVSDHADTLA